MTATDDLFLAVYNATQDSAACTLCLVNQQLASAPCTPPSLLITELYWICEGKGCNLLYALAKRELVLKCNLLLMASKDT